MATKIVGSRSILRCGGALKAAALVLALSLPAAGSESAKSAKPAAVPAYLANHKVGEWFEVIPGKRISDFHPKCMEGQEGFGSLSRITNYSGGTVRWKESWFILKGGGHASTLNNIMIGIKLSSDKPEWEVISPCTPKAKIQQPYQAQPRYLDGKMCTGHSAYKDWFIQSLDRYVQIGSGVSFVGRGGCAAIDTFDWSKKGSESPTEGWTPNDKLTCHNEIYGSPNWVLDDTIYTANSQELYKCRYNDEAPTLVGKWSGAGYRELYGACIVDTKRNRLIWGGELQRGKQFLHSIDPATAVSTQLNLTGEAVPQHTYGGGVYVPTLDRYLLLPSGQSQIYSVDPDTGVVVKFPVTGTLEWPDGMVTVLGRFQYLPELKAVIFQEPQSFEHPPAGRLMMMRTE